MESNGVLRWVRFMTLKNCLDKFVYYIRWPGHVTMLLHIETKILVKFILIKYNNNHKNWNIDYIKQVENFFDKVLKTIQFWK